MTVGKNIRAIREQRGITQDELAALLSVSQKTVSSWEVDRTEPKMGMIEKICVALQCKKSDLIEDTIYQLAEEVAQRNRLMAYCEKLYRLTPEHQIAVASMIDFLTSEEEKNK